MAFTALRVGDVPYITTSRGTTRIALEGAIIWDVPATPAKGPPKLNHATSFGAVYANDLAARVMSAPTPFKFPVGSVIVREKLKTAEAAGPELLAVMVKRAPGFNRAGGDWEFLVFDGGRTRLRSRQKTGSYLKCHSSERASDFVFPLQQEK